MDAEAIGKPVLLTAGIDGWDALEWGVLAGYVPVSPRRGRYRLDIWPGRL